MENNTANNTKENEKDDKKKSLFYDAAKQRRIGKIFYNLVKRLILMSIGVESVGTVYEKVLLGGRDSELREKEGYIYAADAMSVKIEEQIREHQKALWDTIAKLQKNGISAAEKNVQHSGNMLEMLTIDRSKRRQIKFPILKEHPDLEDDKAFQARDLVYIIGIKQVPEESSESAGCRKYEGSIEAISRRNTFRILKTISKKYEAEIKQIQITGPKINGVEGRIYHGSIVRLAARHLEEQALHKILCPPNGVKPKEDMARDIIALWNDLKHSLKNESSYNAKIIKPRLESLGFFDNDLVYTKHGARRPETIERNGRMAEEHDSFGKDEPEK